MTKIEFFKHDLSNKNISSLKNIIKSNIITSGNYGIEVEKKLCKFFQSKYALLTNSWTNGAIATLLALNIKKGDEVIVPAMTFVATANVVEIVGAKPVFVDCDPDTLLIDNEKILKAISKRTKAIFVVHLYGNMFDVKKLKKMLHSKKSSVKIIEDAAHSFESKFNGKKVGSYSDVSIFSFYATKNITCAEGGAIITNNKKYHDKAQYLATQAKDDTFNYIHNECGYNYKINSICAALGISQLRKLNRKIALRKKIYKRYLLNFKNSKNIHILSHNINSKDNYWMNVVYFQDLNYKQTLKLSLNLSKKKIETRRIWRPLNLQLHLKKFETFKIVNATKYYHSSLCIPSDDNISISQIDKVSNYIKKFYANIDNN